MGIEKGKSRFLQKVYKLTNNVFEEEYFQTLRTYFFSRFVLVLGVPGNSVFNFCSDF